MDAVSSEGEAGGVSGIEAGVVGREEMVEVNLKIGVDAEGGVGGLIGWIGRGEGGRGGMERTVAIR